MDEVSRLLALQSGVVSRRQLLALGVRPHDLERALRRRKLTRMLPGVFVDHTGQPTWLQRAWAGVLHWWPAALADGSALRAVAGPGWRHAVADGPVTVAVDVRRTVAPVDGFRPVRLSGLADAVLWNASPPRVRPELAGLRVAAAAPDPMATISVLADLCQCRLTTPGRLLAAAEGVTRLRGRTWLVDVLSRPGRRHLLGSRARLPDAGREAARTPPGRRQEGALTAQGVVLRDVVYPCQDTYVELDGRLFHDSAERRDRDLDRDLEAAVEGRLTVRLGWGQVFARPCRSAGQVGRLLMQRGWQGAPEPCGPACDV